MSAGLNIAALSRRTGVAPDTLRKWEQRYGIIRPSRTAGGQRRYSQLDVARVEWLRDRLSEGYRIGEAAALLEGSPVGASRSAEELRAAIVAAVEKTDHLCFAGLLDQAFALYPVEQALTEIVAPVLRQIGERWEHGDVSVGREHLFTSSVRARLDRLLADLPGGVRGVAVLACAPGERHELGLLMLAVLLRADGWQVAYLGPDTPTTDALEVAAQLSARVLGISVGMAENLATLEGLELPSGTELVLGGAAVTPAVANAHGALYVNGDLERAVGGLRKLAP